MSQKAPEMQQERPPDATDSPPETQPKPDGRSRTSAANGAKGGRPHLHATPLADPSQLVEACAQSFLARGSIPQMSPKLMAPTKRDAESIARITGMPAEEFQAHLAARLRTLAEKTMQRIEEKLDEDAFKPEGLSFLLSVEVDKLARIEGRQQIHNSTVNVQVNNFGARDSLMEDIGLRGGLVDSGRFGKNWPGSPDASKPAPKPASAPTPEPAPAAEPEPEAESSV